jgi:ABC-2 type transport system permease protein
MVHALRQSIAVYKIYLKECFAYPVTWVIWVVTDAVTMFAMPMVMASAAIGSGSGSIRGFEPSQFFLYYMAMFLVASFTTSHFMWEIATEVKEGQFSAQIMRPISYFRYTCVRNLTWRVTRLGFVLPVALLYMWAFRDRFDFSQVQAHGTFWVSLFLGHGLSICLVMAFGMVALVMQDATGLFELYYFPMLFLSGYMFPVAMFPDWVQQANYFLPFFYISGVPTEILIGRIEGAMAWELIRNQAIWVVIFYVAFRLAWKKGIKHYTGVGM